MRLRAELKLIGGLVVLSAGLFAAYLWTHFLIYSAINRERLDPLGIANIRPNEELSEYRVAVFGDSRALGWGRILNDPDSTLNLGIANQTSVQARYRIDYQSNISDLDVIVIQVGINDLKQIKASDKNYESIVSNCKNNIRYIATRAKSMAKRVVVSTVFPLGRSSIWRRVFISDEVSRAIRDVNADILSIEGVEIFDAYAFLVGDNGYVKDAYSKDALHINERAYIEMSASAFF